MSSSTEEEICASSCELKEDHPNVLGANETTPTAATNGELDTAETINNKNDNKNSNSTSATTTQEEERKLDKLEKKHDEAAESSSPAALRSETTGVGEEKQTTSAASTVVATPPVVIRRGRGTFNSRLRTEEMEQQQQQQQGHGHSAGTGSNFNTTHTNAGQPSPPPSGSYAGQNDDADLRKDFGEERLGGDTLANLLFRREKRKRTCVVIGDLPLLQPPHLSIRLLGRREKKPMRLKKKDIRRLYFCLGGHNTATTAAALEDNEEKEDEDDKSPLPPHHHSADDSGSDAEGAEGRAGEKDLPQKEKEEEPVVKGAAASHDESDQADGSPSPAPKSEAKTPAVEAERPPDSGEEKAVPQQSHLPSIIHTAAAAGADSQEVFALRVGGATSSPFAEDDDEADDGEGHAAAPSASSAAAGYRDHDAYALSEQHRQTAVASAVLTTTKTAAFARFLVQEMKSFLLLDDVRRYSVNVRLYFGESYCCAAKTQAGSGSRAGRPLSLSDFVQKVDDESMDLYFLRECPARVAQAITEVCGSAPQDVGSMLSSARITLVTSEGQRTTTRASWSPHENAFRVFDTETYGNGLSWTVFSLDYAPHLLQSTLVAGSDTDSTNNSKVTTEPSSSAAATDVTAGGVPAGSLVGYPYEVEMRAFRRWKPSTSDPSRKLLDRVLEKLSDAEAQLARGEADAYDRLDLLSICKAHYNCDDFHIESIAVEHTWRKRMRLTDLIVDTTSTLLYENFEKALRLVNPRKRVQLINRLHSTTSCVHWKMQPGMDVAINAAPMKDAVALVHQILEKANDPNMPMPPTTTTTTSTTSPSSTLQSSSAAVGRAGNRHHNIENTETTTHHFYGRGRGRGRGTGARSSETDQPYRRADRADDLEPSYPPYRRAHATSHVTRPTPFSGGES